MENPDFISDAELETLESQGTPDFIPDDEAPDFIPDEVIKAESQEAPEFISDEEVPDFIPDEDTPYTVGDFGAEFIAAADFVAGLPAFIYKTAQTPMNAVIASAVGNEQNNFVVGRRMTANLFDNEIGRFAETPVKYITGVDTSNTFIEGTMEWIGEKLSGMTGGEEDNSPKAELLNVAMALLGTRGPKAAYKKIKEATARKPATTLEKAKEGYKPKSEALPENIETPEMLDAVTSKQAIKENPSVDPLPELPQKYKEMPLDKAATILPEDEWLAEFKRRTPEAPEGLAEHTYNELQPRKKGIGDWEALEKFESYAGTYFSNLGNINQRLLQKAVDFEQAIIHAPHTTLHNFEKGLQSLKGMKKPDVKLLERELLNNNLEGAQAALNKAGKGAEGRAVLADVRKTLDVLGAEAKKYKLVTNLRENYLPRFVKDYDGLSKQLGRIAEKDLKTTIDEAREKAFTAGKRFDQFDEANVANKFMQAYTNRGGSKASYRKERKFDEVPEELQKYYAPFRETYNAYVRRAVNDIETAKFFGKNLRKDKDGKIDMENSIGNFILDNLNDGTITPRQVRLAQNNLRARFIGGNRATNRWIERYKNVATASLLNDFSNTARQLGEIPNTMFISQPHVLNGIKGTVAAAAKGLIGKNKLKAEDFGIIDSLAMQEVSGRGVTAQAAKWALKLNFFAPLDRSLKTLNLNSSLHGAKAQLKTPQGRREFAKEWKPRFGSKYNELVADLQAGKITEQTNRYAFSNLVKFQAATKGNWTPKMLDSQSVRAFTTLKSFAINQMNLYRTEAYKKIKRGDTKEGIAMLAKIGLAMHINQASGNMVANWLLGRDQPDQDLGEVASNMAKSFLFNDFAVDSIRKGEIGKGIVQLFGPPLTMFDKPMQDAIQDLWGEGDSKMRYLDLLPNGKSIRGQFFDGADSYNEYMADMEDE